MTTLERFTLPEIVCPHVYKQLGDKAWRLFDPRLFAVINQLRGWIGKPFYVNNWSEGGNLDERGFRCIQCDTVRQAIKENRLYVSAHMTGQAVDFNVEGMTAAEIRSYIISRKRDLAHPIRLELDVPWVHIDTRPNDYNKIEFFTK